MRVWGLLLFAGCYAPHISVGAPCTQGADNCPRGQLCTAGPDGYTCELTPGSDTPDGQAVDAFILPIDVANPQLDDDHDGIVNGDDNCPEKANPNQENEDHDPYGDACDPCPGLAAVVELDGDGDGVGDRCDPHPMDAGDSRFLFEGFHSGPPSGGGWDPFGSWTASMDGVAIAGATHANITIAAPGNSHLTVSTQVTITSVGNGMLHVGGAVLNKQASQESGIACEIYANSMGQKIGLVNANQTGGMPISSADYAWVLGSSYVTTVTQSGNNYTCVVEEPNGTNRATVTGTSGLSNSNHEGGLITADTSARFEWIFIVASP